jgi:hypothetical protein
MVNLPEKWLVFQGKASPDNDSTLVICTMLEDGVYHNAVVEVIHQFRKHGSKWWDNLEGEPTPALYKSFEVQQLLRFKADAPQERMSYVPELPQPEILAPVGYQSQVQMWLVECFGLKVASDLEQRTHRFFEEATELSQSVGMRREHAHQLIDFVFDKPVGDPAQEVGGTMVTLAGVCCAAGLNMYDSGNEELARLNDPSVIAAKRAKHKNKPVNSPLPE